ncbi:MAG: CBS domain-containing protein, partial [Desulfobacterales bacterium]|nr:CBS domain-containing protein [Desulfobacterales bacterium]MDX2509471.1 CBS domain-containing protein [Desulfobacterales bacterium]
KISLNKVRKLTVVDTNRWDRLDRLDSLKKDAHLEIIVFDHHANEGDINSKWRCQEEMGANITLMLRYLKAQKKSISPIQASLFLAGLYEDTGHLTFQSTKAEDAHAAGYLLDRGADLQIVSTFLSPAYGPKQKDVLFHMLQNASRTTVNGNSYSINRLRVHGYVSNLAVVVQMYREILNVDTAFGIFLMDGNRCLVIGRSSARGIDVAAVMRHMGGGGHPGAGSAMLKSADPAAVEAWIRAMIGESHRASMQIRDLMSFPVLSLNSEMTMSQAGKVLREKGYKGSPVVTDGKLVGILSRRDFQKLKKAPQFQSPVKAFMSTNVITIHPKESPGQAAHLMIKNDFGRLPVVDQGKIVGIFSRSDVVADLYGLCPLGNCLATGCKQNIFSFDSS